MFSGLPRKADSRGSPRDVAEVPKGDIGTSLKPSPALWVRRCLPKRNSQIVIVIDSWQSPSDKEWSRVESVLEEFRLSRRRRALRSLIHSGALARISLAEEDIFSLSI